MKKCPHCKYEEKRKYPSESIKNFPIKEIVKDNQKRNVYYCPKCNKIINIADEPTEESFAGYHEITVHTDLLKYLIDQHCGQCFRGEVCDPNCFVNTLQKEINEIEGS